MKPGEARIPSPGPCVRCGSCQEDCPVGIDPMSLLDLYEREAWAEVSRLPAEACIECGICSYVCPAELPLAAAAAVLKRRAEKRNAEVEQGERPGQLATVDVQGGGS